MNNFELAKKYFLEGCEFLEVEDFSQAEHKFKKSLELMPDRASTLTNLSATQLKLKKYSEARTAAEKAILIEGGNHEAYLNLGLIEKELKNLQSAANLFDQALRLKPDYAEGWSNKGATLNELKQYDEAISHFDKALSLKPDYAEGWSNKGNVLNELKRYDEAIAHYDRALSLKSHIDWVSGDLLHAKMKICNWSSLAESLENISKEVATNKKVIQPFSLLSLCDDVLLHKKTSEIYLRGKYPKNLTLGSIDKYLMQEKIRIGYFSADLRNHAVSFLTAELFELHDKKRFEIIAFSFGVDDKSQMRVRISQAVNRFIDVSDMSDLEIAKLARDLHIDIAVDLGGYTAEARTGIFSYRAAPIQLSYIGYLGTMGAEYIDYLLADKIILPEELQKFYSEKIIYLPSYQANDRKRANPDKLFSREELGLPETGFIFCCFNDNYKLSPSMFDSWMRILKAVEGSVLFLYSENKWTKANLCIEAEARGVDKTRLIFGGRIPREEYLARYRVCDLFLDTYPYNAGTTASDALWIGVPVLTLMGRSFASRVAASLLNAIGLPELITNTQEEYEALAIELALSPKKLLAIKLKLAENRLTAPLFDTPLFAKNLETAYIKMYERYRAGLKPEHIFIT